MSVHFNKNAWVDNDFAMKWIQICKDFPGVRQAKFRRKAIICFNLGAQVREDFKRALKKYGVFAHYYPEGCTDLVQVVDSFRRRPHKHRLTAFVRFLNFKDTGDRPRPCVFSFEENRERLVLLAVFLFQESRDRPTLEQS